MTATDQLIRRIEEMRPLLDAARGRVGVQIRAVLVDGTLEGDAKASVKQYEERRQG